MKKRSHEILPTTELPSPASGRGDGGEGGRVPKPRFVRMLRASQTDAEQRLWYHLRDSRFLGLKFRRQRQIGPYIADFVCLEWRLVIEADGGQHGSEADLQRDAWFERNGYTVLRFWNNDVLAQTTSVLEYMREVVIRLGHVEAPALTPGPSPASGRGEQTGALPVPSRARDSDAVELLESVRIFGMRKVARAPQTPELATDNDATDLPSPASGRGEQTGALPVPSRARDSDAVELPESVRITGMRQVARAPQTPELATDNDSTDLPSPASGRGEQTGALPVPSRARDSDAVELPESVRITGMRQVARAPQTPELATDNDSTDLPSPARGRGAGGEGGSSQQRQATDVDNAHPAHGVKPQP